MQHKSCVYLLFQTASFVRGTDGAASIQAVDREERSCLGKLLTHMGTYRVHTSRFHYSRCYGTTVVRAGLQKSATCIAAHIIPPVRKYVSYVQLHVAPPEKSVLSIPQSGGEMRDPCSDSRPRRWPPQVLGFIEEMKQTQTAGMRSTREGVASAYPRILHPGCGTSTLGVVLHRDHGCSVVNADFSKVLL